MTTSDGNLVVHDVELLVELTNAGLLSKHNRIANGVLGANSIVSGIHV